MSTLHYILLSSFVVASLAQGYERFERPYENRDRRQFDRDDDGRIGSGAQIRQGDRYSPYDRYNDRVDRLPERDRFGNSRVDTDRGYGPHGRRDDDYRRRDDDFSNSRDRFGNVDRYGNNNGYQSRNSGGFGGRGRRDVILGHEQLHEPGHMQHHIRHVHEQRVPRQIGQKINNKRVGTGASIGASNDDFEETRNSEDSRGIGNGGGIGSEISNDDGSIGTGAGIRGGSFDEDVPKNSRTGRSIHRHRYDIY